jgi:hypothetical protein
MALTFLGIELNDWVAIIALLVSATVPSVLFIVEHNRSKKSEQIKMSREIWARIEEKADRLQRSVEEARDEVRIPPGPPDYKVATNIAKSLDAEVEYLTYLVYLKLVDDIYIRVYYQVMLEDLKNDIESLCKKYNIYGELKWNEFTNTFKDYDETIRVTPLEYLRRRPLRATKLFTVGVPVSIVKGIGKGVGRDAEAGGQELKKEFMKRWRKDFPQGFWKWAKENAFWK